MADEVKHVDKPWGHEEIWAHTERYVGKVIVVEPGKRLSLQFHERALIITGTQGLGSVSGNISRGLLAKHEVAAQ